MSKRLTRRRAKGLTPILEAARKWNEHRQNQRLADQLEAATDDRDLVIKLLVEFYLDVREESGASPLAYAVLAKIGDLTIAKPKPIEDPEASREKAIHITIAPWASGPPQQRRIEAPGRPAEVEHDGFEHRAADRGPEISIDRDKLNGKGE